MKFSIFSRSKPEPEPEPEPAMTTAPGYMISDELNITLIMDDGQTHLISANHPNHEAILNAIRNSEWSLLPDLVDIPQAMSRYSEGSVTVNEFGEVFYGDEPVHNTVAKRITAFFQQGLPYQPLVRFLENLMANPSRRSVEELYGFLENEGMAITEDGCFVGYKGVRDDYKDVHSGKFDNSPGQIIEMPRRDVDDDARRGCSYGFHVGSQRYAAGWGPRVMLVKVNPADAVSVPYESCEKLRVCRYEVLREVEKTTVLQSPMYNESDFEEEEDEFYDDCEDCGEPEGWCVCDEEDGY